MVQIVLDPDIAGRLARRAERLGTTVQHEALRILWEHIGAEPVAPASSAGEANIDPRFVHDHGFLIFTGQLSPDEIPDHRALQDERIDRLVKDAGASRV